MNGKVKVIRKSNEVLVKAGMSAQYPITGGVQLVAGGGERPRGKQSLPVRVLGGAGALAGGGLGALGALAGRHRSAGGLLQSAISGHAQGKQIGRGLGEKTGRILTASGKAAVSPFTAPARALRNWTKIDTPSRLEPSGNRGQVKVTGSPRTTDASTVSDSQASRVLDATELGNVRVLHPHERVDLSPRSPVRGNPFDVAVTETGNPLDMGAESALNRRAINQQLNPQSNQVNVVDNRRQVRLDEPAFNPIANSPIGQAGMAGAAMIPPVAAGASQEIAADDKAAEAAMNLDPTPERNLPPAFSRPESEGQGTVYAAGQAPTRSLFAGTNAGRSARQRRADQDFETIQRRTAEIALNEAYGNQSAMNAAFADDDRILWGEPMDMAFRLLKMMAFYYR